MEALFRDFRFGCRVLSKNRGFTAIAVLTLALGICANTTIFSWINVTLLNPLPGALRTGEVVSLSRGGRDGSVPPFSYADYVDLRDRNRSFSGLLAFHYEAVGLTGAGKPIRVTSILASSNYFEVLGVRPLLGRGFLPEEEKKPGGAPVVVISYGLWQSCFGMDTNIIGRKIELNRHPYTIVGVAPRAFPGGQAGIRSDLWVPLAMDPVITGWSRLFNRDRSWLMLFGRLNPGADLRQAQGEMNFLMQQIIKQYPDSHQGPNEITLDPLWRSPYGGNYTLSTFLPMLMGIAGVVLLLACANVANLLLVRSVGRRREIAIRLSMGASRWQLIRQFLAESLLLALAAGSIALFFTPWTAGSVSYLLPPTSAPTPNYIEVDRTVLLVTLLISTLTGVTFSIFPALRSSKLAPALIMKEEMGTVSAGLSRARLARGLVVAQISLSLLLLICAGLFLRSLKNAQHHDPGFDPDHVLLASFDLKSVGLSQDQGIEFDRQLLAKLEALPGVESAALANWVPFSGGMHTYTIAPEGYVPRLHESMEVRRANVSPNYLQTMRIPLIAGREFTLQDTTRTQPVSVVDQTLAERYWPGQNAIGKRFQVGSKWFIVVGIARNSTHSRLNEPPEPALYLPLFQDYYHDPTIHLRGGGRSTVLCFNCRKNRPWTQRRTTRGRCHASKIYSTGRKHVGTGRRNLRWRFWVARPGARHGGHLRSNRLYDTAEDTRIWHSHGTGGPTRRRVPVGAEPGSPPDTHRLGHRINSVTRPNSIAAEPTLGCGSHGCFDVRGCCGFVLSRSAFRLLYPGAPGSQAESLGGTAIRMISWLKSLDLDGKK